MTIVNSNINSSNNENSENDTTPNLSTLPMQALKEVPTPNADAKEITALVKDSGRVTGYQLSDGSILDKEEGIELAKQGGIQGVGVSVNKGNEYLKSLPDGSEDNNLGSLPSISTKEISDSVK